MYVPGGFKLIGTCNELPPPLQLNAFTETMKLSLHCRPVMVVVVPLTISQGPVEQLALWGIPVTA